VSSSGDNALKVLAEELSSRGLRKLAPSSCEAAIIAIDTLINKVKELNTCITTMLAEDLERTHTHSVDMGSNHGLRIAVQQGEKGKAWHQARRKARKLTEGGVDSE